MPPGHATDLTSWPGQFWPSDRAVYRWTGGAPVRNASAVRAGATSSLGIFELTIPDVLRTGGSIPFGTTRPRLLTIYLGLFNFGPFSNAALLTLNTPGKPQIKRTFDHSNGNNNDWLTLKVQVVFDGALNVTWSLLPAEQENQKRGLVSLQAATLSPHDGKVGEMLLRSATTYP